MNIKFNDSKTSFGSKKIPVDPYIQQNISGSKFTFLVLYVDDILLVANDLVIIAWEYDFLSMNFEMKDMGEKSYVIRIEIFHDSRDRNIS